MESIYILQKTYENLYALSFPVLDFLERNLPRISSTWMRSCVYDVLEKDFSSEDITKRELKEFDIYYLFKVLLTDTNWNSLKNLDATDDFYTDYHRSLLFDVKKIRNDVAHPRIEKYTEQDFIDWTGKIEAVANLFGKELGQLVADLHKSEKDRLFNFIAERTFDITMNSPDFKKLPQSKQESVARTKKRLQEQATAAGIMALFEDSYFLHKGQPIKEGLEEYHLPTFENVMEEVKDFYYFGKWSPVKNSRCQ
ncbi:MAG: hypothetical protein IJ530_15250 [Treponema sp.]|uniref:hypothetical protein n=1 Tax=Treponema sp. TaxID=166 RepID=UPI001C1C8356|nr:hypothetical protein [Treponema sp.]MBQ8681087.1 hypothetical protein [Treponema sp.]MBR1535797.1 hypothetical protein [Treponema sp.]